MWAPDYPDWLLAETAETQKREKRTGKDREGQGQRGRKNTVMMCLQQLFFVCFVLHAGL